MKRTSLTVSVILVALGVVALGVVGSVPGFSLNASGQAQESLPTPIFQYPDFPPTPTVASAPAQQANLAATLLFATDFATPQTLDAWDLVDLEAVPSSSRSVWTIEDGRLAQQRTATLNTRSLQETVAVTGQADWTDYEITAQVHDQSNGTFGLVARYDGNSFYRYSIIADSYPDTPKQLLEKVVDGVATPLAALDQPGHRKNQWYTVALRVVGSTIQVTLDGEVVLEATDSTLTAGQAGVYTRALGGILFDNIQVTER
ncbi:MAG: DUF1080 domain-containing protein [Chloroflexales bacterium]|nr:DUF1080 domain-containing protein [Chloroflexales bacterium]